MARAYSYRYPAPARRRRNLPAEATNTPAAGMPEPGVRRAPADQRARRGRPFADAPARTGWSLADLASLGRDGQAYSGPGAAYRLLWERLPADARPHLAALAGAAADSPAARRAAARLRAALAESSYHDRRP